MLDSDLRNGADAANHSYGGGCIRNANLACAWGRRRHVKRLPRPKSSLQISPLMFRVRVCFWAWFGSVTSVQYHILVLCTCQESADRSKYRRVYHRDYDKHSTGFVFRHSSQDPVLSFLIQFYHEYINFSRRSATS